MIGETRRRIHVNTTTFTSRRRAPSPTAEKPAAKAFNAQILAADRASVKARPSGAHRTARGQVPATTGNCPAVDEAPATTAG